MQPTPNPAVATLSTLTSVSCGAPGSCVAVGYYLYPHNGQARLAEAWHGTSWSLTQAGNPPNAAYSELNSVSCTAAAACVAVGDDLNLSSDDTVTLAQVWNGSTWQVNPALNPADAIVTRLFGVSCTSPAACTAVGNSIFDATSRSAGSPLAVTLAEVWNGTTWTIQATPNPAGTTGIDALDSVSCTSPRSCSAVGYGSGAGTKTLGEVWNGTAWAIVATPNPGPGYNSLAGVSCSAAAACAAVGAYHDTAGTHLPLAQAWNGTAWTVQTLPSPVGAATSTLAGVSCGAPQACTAVGFFDNSPSSSRTLAEAWNGTSWAIQPTPDAAGFLHSTLASVSCTSASACLAVGRSYTHLFAGGVTLAESRSGSTWKIVPGATLPGTNGALSGVSCTSPTACMAVGDYTDTAGSGLPLAESWNGTAWAVLPVPVPARGYDGVLEGVSCTSPSACTAVGSYTSSGSLVGLAERWDGTAWTVQATPAGDDVLHGVSCSTATTCTAVGYSLSYPQGLSTLAEGWQHGTWSVQQTPFLPGPFFHSLNGVSCRAAGVCAAVGNYSTGLGVSVTLAEAWNGSTWTVQTTPPPSSGTDSALASVSATPGAGFTAVGGHLGSAGVGVTLAETGPG